MCLLRGCWRPLQNSVRATRLTHMHLYYLKHVLTVGSRQRTSPSVCNKSNSLSAITVKIAVLFAGHGLCVICVPILALCESCGRAACRGAWYMHRCSILLNLTSIKPGITSVWRRWWSRTSWRMRHKAPIFPVFIPCRRQFLQVSCRIRCGRADRAQHCWSMRCACNAQQYDVSLTPSGTPWS